MQSLPEDPILKFLPNTLEYVRKQYDLDRPERIEEALSILYDWLEKQDHFIKKDYGAEYLERLLINCKGSVERSKKKLDKMCTYRTLLPKYFEPFQIKQNPVLKELIDAYLPKMTDNYKRVFIMRNFCKKIDFTLLDYFRWLLLKCEYMQLRDYCNGTIIILDYVDANILEFIKVLNLAEVKHYMSIMTAAYGMRIEGIHIITPSKMIDVVVNIAKQAMSEKLGRRIHIHKDFDPIYNLVPKDILPIDYGGKEKSLQELNDLFTEEIISESFQSHLEEMRTARIIEALRPLNSNMEYMGVPGSFRKLTID